MNSKTLTTLLLFIQFTTANAQLQVNENVDSLAIEICNSYNKINGKLDSAQVQDIFFNHLKKYISKMDEATAQKAAEKISIRLQTQCEKFIDYFKKYKNPNWISVEECPRATISEKDADNFFTIESFWYIEPGGDTTHVKITTTEWIDTMKDGTYSKLSLERTSPADFYITFIESTNSVKANMSKVGDRYNYTLLSKADGFYSICVSLPNIKKAAIFKLHYQ